MVTKYRPWILPANKIISEIPFPSPRQYLDPHMGQSNTCWSFSFKFDIIDRIVIILYPLKLQKMYELYVTAK